MRAAEGIPPEKLQSLVEYDATSGELRWKAKPAKQISVGDPAFKCKTKNGYLSGHLCGKTYYAHRVAWALYHGHWPLDEIDHIDGNKQNNSISNLRCATKSDNMRNMKLPQRNTTGVIGVQWLKKNRKFRAFITLNGRLKHLGCFEHLSDAAQARKAEGAKNGFHPNHGRILE